MIGAVFGRLPWVKIGGGVAAAVAIAAILLFVRAGGYKDGHEAGVRSRDREVAGLTSELLAATRSVEALQAALAVQNEAVSRLEEEARAASLAADEAVRRAAVSKRAVAPVQRRLAGDTGGGAALTEDQRLAWEMAQ